MAKPNKKKVKNFGSSFFDPFIKSRGDTFVSMERPERIAKKVPLLLKDLAYGNITEKYYKYFTEGLVMRIIIPEIYRNFHKAQIHYLALQEYHKENPSQDIFAVMQEDGVNVSLYGTAYEGFQQMAMAGGDPAYLVMLGLKLKQYKFSL